jgi:hypothetical protein
MEYAASITEFRVYPVTGSGSWGGASPIRIIAFLASGLHAPRSLALKVFINAE